MSKVNRKQSGGESMDDCWSDGLNGFRKANVYCPVVKGMCKREDCMFYSAEVDVEPAEYDESGWIILDGVEPCTPEYDKEYKEMVRHRCLVLEILEGLHWLVGRWDDNGENEDGLKSLVATMSEDSMEIKNFEQNKTRYCVTE